MALYRYFKRSEADQQLLKPDGPLSKDVPIKAANEEVEQVLNLSEEAGIRSHSSRKLGHALAYLRACPCISYR